MLKKKPKQIADSWNYCNDMQYSSFTCKLNLFLHAWRRFPYWHCRPYHTSEEQQCQNLGWFWQWFTSTGVSEETATGAENTNSLKNNHLGSDSANETISWSVQQLLAKCVHNFFERKRGLSVGIVHSTIKPRCQT